MRCSGGNAVEEEYELCKRNQNVVWCAWVSVRNLLNFATTWCVTVATPAAAPITMTIPLPHFHTNTQSEPLIQPNPHQSPAARTHHGRKVTDVSFHKHRPYALKGAVPIDSQSFARRTNSVYRFHNVVQYDEASGIARPLRNQRNKTTREEIGTCTAYNEIAVRMHKSAWERGMDVKQEHIVGFYEGNAPELPLSARSTRDLRISLSDVLSTRMPLSARGGSGSRHFSGSGMSTFREGSMVERSSRRGATQRDTTGSLSASARRRPVTQQRRQSVAELLSLHTTRRSKSASSTRLPSTTRTIQPLNLDFTRDDFSTARHHDTPHTLTSRNSARMAHDLSQISHKKHLHQQSLSARRSRRRYESELMDPLLNPYRQIESLREFEERLVVDGSVSDSTEEG